MTCCLFFANILMLNVNDNGNVSGNVSGQFFKVINLLNTSPFSSLGNEANLVGALLKTHSISEALKQGSTLFRGGAPDAISKIGTSRLICPKQFSARLCIENPSITSCTSFSRSFSSRENASPVLRTTNSKGEC